MTRKRGSVEATDTLEVWIDVNFLGQPHRGGLLCDDRGTVRFRYDTAWLHNPACFMLDPSLSLDEHGQTTERGCQLS